MLWLIQALMMWMLAVTVAGATSFLFFLPAPSTSPGNDSRNLEFLAVISGPNCYEVVAERTCPCLWAEKVC